VLTIILPPLGVLLGKGFGWAFILNIILTILGYIPGLIHAFWVQTKTANQSHYHRSSNGIREFAGAILCLNT
jgi:uncharacterized membrane protein YqaE (UPF0057 family)